MFNRNKFYKEHMAEYSKCMKRIKEYSNFDAFQEALNMGGQSLYSLTREEKDSVQGVNHLLSTLIQAFLDDGQYIVVREEPFPEMRKRMAERLGKELPPHYVYRFELDYDRPGINEEDFLQVIKLCNTKDKYYKDNIDEIEKAKLSSFKDKDHPAHIWRKMEECVVSFMCMLYQEQER